MESRFTITQTKSISDILINPKIKKSSVFLDIDKTTFKLNKDYNAHLGGDDWYETLFTYGMLVHPGDALSTFALITLINDTMQQYIRLKRAEKNTITVLRTLLTDKIPIFFATARGYSLMERTIEQIQEALQLEDKNLTFNRTWSTLPNDKNHVELFLDFDFYSLPHLSDKPPYKYTYVFDQHSQTLYYFDRLSNAKEISITQPKNEIAFEAAIHQLLFNHSHMKVTHEQLLPLFATYSSHQPERHSVIYHEGILFCGGEDKGEAISKFRKWASLEDKHTFMIDDKLGNVKKVKEAMSKTDNNKRFYGFYYRRVKDNFNYESSCVELAKVYPELTTTLSNEAKAIIDEMMKLPSIYTNKNPASLFAPKNSSLIKQDLELTEQVSYATPSIIKQGA